MPSAEPDARLDLTTVRSKPRVECLTDYATQGLPASDFFNPLNQKQALLINSPQFPRCIARLTPQTRLSSRKIFILKGNNDVPLPKSRPGWGLTPFHPLSICTEQLIPFQDHEASGELSLNLFIFSENHFCSEKRPLLVM